MVGRNTCSHGQIRAVWMFVSPASSTALVVVGHKIDCQRVSYHIGMRRDTIPADTQQQELLSHASGMSAAVAAGLPRL